MRVEFASDAGRHHLRMATIGFLLGSVFTVPTAVVMSGRLFSTADVTVANEAPPAIEKVVQERLSSEAKAPPAVLVASTAGAGVGAITAQETSAASSVRVAVVTERDPIMEARKALMERLETARALLLRGDVERVRDILAADETSPEAAFIIAENSRPKRAGKPQSRQFPG